jgi:hypothetical protein
LSELEVFLISKVIIAQITTNKYKIKEARYNGLIFKQPLPIILRRRTSYKNNSIRSAFFGEALSPTTTKSFAQALLQMTRHRLQTAIDICDAKYRINYKD